MKCGGFILKGNYMISPTLKVGDKFTDGNRTFEVLSVVGNGVYISKCVATDVKPEYVIEEPKAEIKEEKAYTKTEIMRMPKSDLEELCKANGLEIGTTSEMKKILLEKLGL